MTWVRLALQETDGSEAEDVAPAAEAAERLGGSRWLCERQEVGREGRQGESDVSSHLQNVIVKSRAAAWKTVLQNPPKKEQKKISAAERKYLKLILSVNIIWIKLLVTTNIFSPNLFALVHVTNFPFVVLVCTVVDTKDTKIKSKLSYYF